LDTLVAIAKKFKPKGKIIDIREFGCGNINDTFLVTLESEADTCFVLQRVNTQVFVHPERVMRNMRTVTEHIRRKLKRAPPIGGRRWQMPQVLLTQDGRDHCLENDGSFWRAISLVEDAQSFDTVKTMDQAVEVGHALGMFHALLCDLPPDRLADTLEGFHDTPRYLRHYEAVLSKHRPIKSLEMNYCVSFVSKRRDWAHVLENARAKGELHSRTIHGDPKVSNIMMDTATGQAISIVDLDTVKPGLVHYDIGDCLRSACNLKGEESDSWEKVGFDIGLCQAILKGYLSMASAFLTVNDYDYLYDAVRLIAFELGLRYFTDYLEGNIYFKVRHPEHNLARALVQFRLTESIEFQASAIRTIIQDMR
jgi:Ser/Thr protein kinase RdoA (MazF antagonist)